MIEVDVAPPKAHEVRIKVNHTTHVKVTCEHFSLKVSLWFWSQDLVINFPEQKQSQPKELHLFALKVTVFSVSFKAAAFIRNRSFFSFSL